MSLPHEDTCIRSISPETSQWPRDRALQGQGLPTPQDMWAASDKGIWRGSPILGPSHLAQACP